MRVEANQLRSTLAEAEMGRVEVGEDSGEAYQNWALDSMFQDVHSYICHKPGSSGLKNLQLLFRSA